MKRIKKSDRKIGTGCFHEGSCDTCPYNDCIATSQQCIHRYNNEEKIAKEKYRINRQEKKND